jgi:hypothetical protein
MFRNFDSGAPLSNKQQWSMSPSRYAWMYLDHMLSHIRKAIRDAGSAPEATPSRRIPYSREEVSVTLARMAMKRADAPDSPHPAYPALAIVWGSAMGHQYEGQLKAREVRINLNRPTGGTNHSLVPTALRGSPASPILRAYKDNFHTLLLVVGGGNSRTYIMTILTLRLATIAATQEFLLNGKSIERGGLFKKIALSQIAEGYYFHALYDTLKICLEAIKNCLKNNCFWDLYKARDMQLYLDGLAPLKKALWAAITPHCNMTIMQDAARLVYNSPRTSTEELNAKVTQLTSDYGICRFLGEGVDADALDAAVLDTEGNPQQGNRYMRNALSLVAENGVVTEAFGQALLRVRRQFCENRIKHIEESENGGALTAPGTDVASANVNLALETFGIQSYKAEHDTNMKRKAQSQP